MPDPNDTAELRLEQARRESVEREAAQAADEESSSIHERRAEKAAYLRERLAEAEQTQSDQGEAHA